MFVDSKSYAIANSFIKECLDEFPQPIDAKALAILIQLLETCSIHSRLCSGALKGTSFTKNRIALSILSNDMLLSIKAKNESLMATDEYKRLFARRLIPTTEEDINKRLDEIEKQLGIESTDKPKLKNYTIIRPLTWEEYSTCKVPLLPGNPCPLKVEYSIGDDTREAVWLVPNEQLVLPDCILIPKEEEYYKYNGMIIKEDNSHLVKV